MGLSTGHSPFREVRALPRSTSSSSYLVIPFVLLFSSPFPFLSMFPLPQHFLPFLKYVFTEMPPTWLMGSAELWPEMGPLQRHLEMAVSNTGQPLISHRCHACSPSAAKTWPFTSNMASKKWAFVALAERYASYKLSKCISLCLILREVSTDQNIYFWVITGHPINIRRLL